MVLGEINSPRIGDDGIAPDRRAWIATPLAVMLWSGIFTIVYFATRDTAIEDAVAADGYITKLFIAFVLTIFFVIPTTTLLLGTMIEDLLDPSGLGGVFAASVLVGGTVGAITAVFIYFLDTNYGWLPFTQFIIPSALTGALTWLLVEPCRRSRALTTVFTTLMVVVVIASLGIGVAVLTGRI